eukprot:9269073-Pyramimonas_sp.AAC.1
MYMLPTVIVVKSRPVYNQVRSGGAVWATTGSLEVLGRLNGSCSCPTSRGGCGLASKAMRCPLEGPTDSTVRWPANYDQ